MARPIKETPVLRGKDADLFEKKIIKAKPESQEKIAHAKKVFEKFKAIATFSL